LQYIFSGKILGTFISAGANSPSFEPLEQVYEQVQRAYEQVLNRSEGLINTFFRMFAVTVLTSFVSTSPIILNSTT